MLAAVVRLEPDHETAEVGVSELLGECVGEVVAGGEDNGGAVAGGSDELVDIVAEQRFAAGEANGYGADRFDLVDDPDGVVGVEAARLMFAVAAMRAAVWTLVGDGEVARVWQTGSFDSCVQESIEGVGRVWREEGIDTQLAVVSVRVFVAQLGCHVEQMCEGQSAE